MHGFTSPLGVLLPALCYLLTGAQSYVAALWLFRVVCIAAFVGGGVLVLHALPADPPWGRVIQVIFALLYVLEAKTVAYTVNGMETAFMLLFLGSALYLYAQGTTQHWLAHGVCWAGLMWTRPDSCVYVAVLGVANFVFASAAARSGERGTTAGEDRASTDGNGSTAEAEARTTTAKPAGS